MEGTTTDEIKTRIKNLMQYVPFSNFQKEDRLQEAMKEVEKHFHILKFPMDINMERILTLLTG
jgi:hypothetical protein